MKPRRTALRRARRGLTLLELLLVLVLLSLVLGAGAGALAALDLGRRQAGGLVRNTLRAAQNTALARRVPTEVVIDLEHGRLTPSVWRVVGTWSFEDGLSGAFALDGVASGGRPVEDGYLGRALDFSGEPLGALVEWSVAGDPAWDPAEGFRLELAVRLESRGGFRLLNLGNSAGLDVLASGALRGWLVPEVTLASEVLPSHGAPVVVESESRALPLGRWAVVALEYDRRALVVRVDGVRLAERPESAPVFALSGPLRLGDPETRLGAGTDQLVVRILSRTGVVLLPEGVRFAGQGRLPISFAPGGGLDRARHSGPVLLEIEHSDGSREPIRVGVHGTVEG